MGSLHAFLCEQDREIRSDVESVYCACAYAKRSSAHTDIKRFHRLFFADRAFITEWIGPLRSPGFNADIRGEFRSIAGSTMS
jgi:hypothetical protein